MTDLPKALGLSWRRKGDSYVAYWLCGKNASKAAYPIRTARVYSGRFPTAADCERILIRCRQLRREARDWVADRTKKRPSRSAVRPGFVYFAKAGEAIKIGFSSDVAKRLQALQTASGHPIELLGSVKATPDREHILHQMFRHIRIKGEWYQATPELLSHVENALRTPIGTRSNVSGASP